MEIRQDRAGSHDPSRQQAGAVDSEARLQRRKRFLYDLMILGFGFFGMVVFGSFVWESLMGRLPASPWLFLFLSVLLLVSLYLVLDGIRKLVR